MIGTATVMRRPTRWLPWLPWLRASQMPARQGAHAKEVLAPLDQSFPHIIH